MASPGIATATFSVFNPVAFGHGGERRTRQLDELLTGTFRHSHIRLPFRYNSSNIPPLKSRLRHSYNLANIYRAGAIPPGRMHPGKLLDECLKFFVQEEWLRKYGEVITQSETIILENTFTEFLYIPFIARKKYNKRIVACPHNLESLAPGQLGRWYGSGKYDFLHQELESLRWCDKVFTISEEEQWLLNLFDIPAQYLPYFPSRELQAHLATIRQHRQGNDSSQGFYLVLGSAGNPPTKAGMISLISDLQNLPSIATVRLKVAGYGTETLASYRSENIDVLGSVGEEDLSRLMRDCRAAIVHQGFSSGALTKIPEYLLAGIPVIVHEGSARSFKRFNGVHTFSHRNELYDLLNEQLPIPAIPQSTATFEHYFLQSVSNNANITVSNFR